ncbi:MAG: thioredoxin domain-containing protein [Thermoplasmataceae archaeon]
MSGKPNHLIGQKSPYLLQHLYNPVDWYPWSEEAFQKAESENKPVFLSIGYSTCHWCHVMERESFEDPVVADEMNRTFVCIKVDREERPDIDAAYMMVSQMLTGSGGWPLNVILTPDRKPIFSLTYIPKESRRGMIGMIDLCRQVRELWNDGREEIDRRVQDIMERVSRLQRPDPKDVVSQETVQAIFRQLSDNFDPDNGGFGMAPKFPTPHNLMFLLGFWQVNSSDEARMMVSKTLDCMRIGGIWDHVGFGFHRYSTDANWVVPHFEKMLYDNVLLMATYATAYGTMGTPLYGKVATEIFTFLERDMLSPEGAYYSAIDADSEGEEGKYYTWKYSEIVETLGSEDGEKFCDLFNVQPNGNYSEEATGRTTLKNILYMRSVEDLSDPETFKFASLCLEKLLESRNRRMKPARDEKILADMNGLAIAALSIAHRFTGDKRFLSAALRTASFMVKNMYKNGKLLHRYKDGEAGIEGFLDDYAFLSWGLLELFLETSDPGYLKASLDLTKYSLKNFRGKDGSALFLSEQNEGGMIIPVMEGHDGAIPSGNSATCLNLVRLSTILGDPALRNEAERIANDFGKEIASVPMYHSFMGMAIQSMVSKRFFIKAPSEFTILPTLREPLFGLLVQQADLVSLHDKFEKEAADLLFVMKSGPGQKKGFQVCSDTECFAPVNSLERAIELVRSSRTHGV